ncbi:4-alpha-glucanotransferase [Gluconacetobacter johannae DSM 13595]|uniref:4-alpha-glucanotransferase n=1 Tax=Gluconacetobacter johannae TaxID=112140 RepID=A0A7W4J5S2_9PROT|nr:4-alpha-glucanotransferase [Gluconacetobacter johannae]MBB2174947.1 4-alpha-glucanotransferase [Gluconacetobacter johannae]GBQ87905.1 4-alpha-glucanotransferase [Gluconacetobacter johannae DSM 13595]
MSDPSLQARARQAGLATSWRGTDGKMHRVSADSLRSLLRVLEGGRASAGGAGLPALVVGQVDVATPLPPFAVSVAADGTVPFRLVFEDGETLSGRAALSADGRVVLPAVKRIGYHTLDIGPGRTILAMAPPSCRTVRERAGNGGGRAWGIAAQIYGLRAPGDGGIGHFGALASLARQAATAGADALAISPVHAMFAARPDQYSPYSPSSRLFLNTLLADACCWFQPHDVALSVRRQGIPEGALKQLEDAPLIDWPRAAALRLQILRGLYDDHVRALPPAEMTAFVQAQGRALHQHAVFEALHAQQLQRGPRGGNWRIWPTALRNPDSPEVARFAEERQHEVGFHLFLQWLAARSLGQAGRAAQEAGMKIGLIADLAVGTDPSGSQCWMRQDEFLIGASVGAPPDPLGPIGQNWGLTTFSPGGMQAHGYRAFIETLRAAFARQGGVRIDHVMGLERLWIIPDGGAPTDGAYLCFPRQDLMRLVALESYRHDAIVIGEDLGTVSADYRRHAERRAIMGMNVLWFQRDRAGGFMPAARWNRNAAAMTSTHDLPTVSGWWLGTDIGWRKALRQLPKGARVEDALAARDHDRAALWAVLHTGGEPSPMPPVTEEGARIVADAAARFIGITPSPLAILPLEDVLGLIEQPNLPGTVTGHPNWQRRYPGGRDLALLSRPEAARRLGLLRDGRRAT